MIIRDFGCVPTRFWMNKKNRTLSPEAKVVALHLMSGPNSNMMGIFYLPLETLSVESALPLPHVETIIHQLEEYDICRYDHDADYVWVILSTDFEIRSGFKASDKRVIAFQNQWAALPDLYFKEEFLTRYGEAYHLKMPSGDSFEAENGFLTEKNTPSKGHQGLKNEKLFTNKPLRSPFEAPSEDLVDESYPQECPFEAPSKPLRSPFCESISLVEAPSKPEPEPVQVKEPEEVQETEQEKKNLKGEFDHVVGTQAVRVICDFWKQRWGNKKTVFSPTLTLKIKDLVETYPASFTGDNLGMFLSKLDETLKGGEKNGETALFEFINETCSAYKRSTSIR